MKDKQTGKTISDESILYHEVQSEASLLLYKVLSLHALKKEVDLDAADKLLIVSEFAAVVAAGILKEHPHLDKEELLDMFIEGAEEYFKIINTNQKKKDSDGRG